MKSNVLELPHFVVQNRQRRCIDELQYKHNRITVKCFQRQNKINILLCVAILVLTSMICVQHLTIKRLEQKPSTIQIVDDGSVDLTGLDLPPLKPL